MKKHDVYEYTVKMLEARNKQIEGLLAERDLLGARVAQLEAENNEQAIWIAAVKAELNHE